MIEKFTLLRKSALFICVFAGLTLFSSTVKAQFTNGNVVVLQTGDGTSTLSSASAPLFLKEYNTTTAAQTTPVSSVAIPTTGIGRLVNSGSASSEGQITLSSDSTLIVVAGYDTTTGIAGITSSSSANIARAIDTVGNLGVPGRADTSRVAFSGNNIRSATRNGGNNYWAAGANTGTYYMGNLAAPNVIQSATTTNTRVILAANGKLYFTTSSGTPRLLRINSQPTTGPATVDTLLLISGGSPYGFAINAAETVVYVADDGTSSGGIQKWTLSGSTWSLAYTLSVGTGLSTRSVIADWSTTNPTLYAVTTVAGGSLVKIVDSNASATAVTLASGTATGVFRSVAFAPRGICTPPSLSAVATPVTCTANGTVTLTVTGGSGPFTYAYTGPGTYTAATQNISNLQPGTYSVTVSGGGCSATTSATVANNASITATATATGSAVRCQGDSVTLTANAGTGYKYQWKLNNTVLTKDTFQIYKAGATGSYTVTVSSGTNCSATSAAISVTINPLPAKTVTITGSTTFCNGGSVQFCAPATTGYTYQWRLNGVNIPFAISACYTASASGIYTVIITNSVTGCMDSSSGIIVTVGAPPSATITPSGRIAICQGNFVILHTNKSTGLTYSWTRNGTVLTGGGVTDSTLVASQAGIYTVTVSSGVGCSSTSAPDTLVVNPRPVTTVTLLTPAIICAGDTVRVRAAGGSGNLYQWSVAGLGITPAQPDSNYSIITPANLPSTSTYFFRAIIITPAGCKDSSVLQAVTVNPLPAPVLVNNGGLLSTGFYAAYQWYRDGVLIPGITGSAYAPAQNGSYTVRVTNANGCSNTSAAVIITGLNVNNMLSRLGILIYPNPVQDILKIDAPYTVNAVVKDVQGREVMRSVQAKQLSIGRLSQGVYSITLYNENGVLLGTQLIIKNAQ